MVMLLREPARLAAVREHRLAPWFAVVTVCFGAFMGQFDASVVTLAFPALQRQFTVGLAGVQWVSLAYLLTLIVLLVPAGRWSDRLGRKLVGVHVAVALAFHGPPEVRHLNGDGQDNTPGNLAWGSRRENERDKKRKGKLEREGETRPLRVRTSATGVLQ